MENIKEDYKYLEKEADLTIAKIFSFPEGYPEELVIQAQLIYNGRISNINTSLSDREKLKAYPEIFTAFKSLMAKNASKEKATRFLVKKNIDKHLAEEIADRFYNQQKDSNESIINPKSAMLTIILVVLLILKLARYFSSN